MNYGKLGFIQIKTAQATFMKKKKKENLKGLFHGKIHQQQVCKVLLLLKTNWMLKQGDK